MLFLLWCYVDSGMLKNLGHSTIHCILQDKIRLMIFVLLEKFVWIVQLQCVFEMHRKSNMSSTRRKMVIHSTLDVNNQEFSGMRFRSKISVLRKNEFEGSNIQHFDISSNIWIPRSRPSIFSSFSLEVVDLGLCPWFPSDLFDQLSAIAIAKSAWLLKASD